VVGGLAACSMDIGPLATDPPLQRPNGFVFMCLTTSSPPTRARLDLRSHAQSTGEAADCIDLGAQDGDTMPASKKYSIETRLAARCNGR